MSKVSLYAQVIYPRSSTLRLFAPGTGVPHLQENSPTWDLTVGLYRGSYGGPIGVGFFLWARYPCTLRCLAPGTAIEGPPVISVLILLEHLLNIAMREVITGDTRE